MARASLFLRALAAATLMTTGLAGAVDVTDAMRGAPITGTTPPPLLQNSDNSDIKRQRNYAMQPPVIPHKIDGYQLDKDVNRCLYCHSRTRIEETRAIPLSVTHYQDRDGNFLADVSPRRYFCDTCHVVQMEAKPLVGNGFQDVEGLVRKGREKPAAKKK